MVSIGILLMLLLALIVVIYTNYAQKKLLRQRMEQQNMELEYQQALVQRNLMTQEEERQRIAANLHDDIGSKLGVLHLTFHRLQRSAVQTKDQELLGTEISDLIAHTLERVRQISHELLPPTLEDFGILEALKELARQIEQTGSAQVELALDLTREEVGTPQTELQLYRIVQELTNNSLKYAEASLITVKLFQNNGKKCLQYRDDGKGFDVESRQNKGLGLKNLESRAALIGGHIDIVSQPGHGFEATLFF
jgi:signal transduction histidine kinase